MALEDVALGAGLAIIATLEGVQLSHMFGMERRIGKIEAKLGIDEEVRPRSERRR